MMATATVPPQLKSPLIGSCQTDEAGLAAVLQVYNDVTERLKRSHEALAGEVCRLRDELHEKNLELARRERLSALGEMAAGVAHEIRNPLGGIGLYASLLEKDLSDRPVQREIAQRIGVGVHNVEKIVRDILAFAGGAQPRFERVSLGRIIESLMSAVAPQARNRNIAIDVDAKLRTTEVRADVGLVERAVLNLVLNALEAVESNGRVCIRRGGEPSGDGMVDMIVEDDGPGIEADRLQRIFHPFFTTKDGGTGLGLAIVHGIAESHGGCVRATNRMGGGAAFVLTLPAAPPRRTPIADSDGQ